MTKKRNNSGVSITATDLFLAILALMLISVSFYQTWRGLEQIFKGGAIMVSLVLSLLLLFLCWMLRDYKLKGKKTGGLVGIYIFIASFCFVANFNALYTNMMKTDIYIEELKGIEENFSNLENDISANLNYKYPKNIAQQIEIKKKQLIEQIQDPANVGIGDRAKALIRDLERLLGQRIDLLTVKDGDYENLALRMGAQVDNMVMDLSPDEKRLKNDINSANLKWTKEVQKAINLPKSEIDINAPAIVNLALSDYNKIGHQAQSVLGRNKIDFKDKKSEILEVGKMGYAFKHAISNFSIYTVLILAGCILLDFVIVIIILLVTTTENNNNNVRSTRRGGTIV